MSSIRQRTNVPGQQEKEALIQKAEIKERQEEQATISAGKKWVPPTYTMKQLLDAIPSHCYHRSALRSSLYIVQDFAAIAALYYASFKTDSTLMSFNLSTPVYNVARVAVHTAISITLGLFFTGIWIIAHECGHQAFSSSKNINNSVGWALHSMLLVPYHSWRISHGRHHAATGHMTRDEVFVPKTRSGTNAPAAKDDIELEGISLTDQRREELKEALGDAPIVVLFNLVCQQLFGWPAYLIRNASGQRSYPKWTNHFQPSSVYFKPEHWRQIIASDIGLVLMIAGLSYWGHVRGSREVIVLWMIPYLMANHWLVGITFLQHTDPLSPHYSAKEWTFARGALTTIDRRFFGPIGKHVLHGICETHVAHHASSKIPHYSAWEATEAIKKFVGPEYYQYNHDNFLVSLWKNYRACRFVEDEGDVLFFKNAEGVAQRYARVEDLSQSDSGVDVSADKN